MAACAYRIMHGMDCRTVFSGPTNLNLNPTRSCMAWLSVVPENMTLPVCSRCTAWFSPGAPPDLTHYFERK